MEPLVTAARIRACRKKRGLTQGDLGREIGVTASAIMRYELGQRKISVETVRRIAGVLDVPVGYLLCDTDSLDGKLDTPWAKMVVGSDESLGNRLASAFLSLNLHGREKAVERVEELTEVPKYKEPEEIDWWSEYTKEQPGATPPPDAPQRPQEGK